jgi:hypothetical protein
MASRVDQHVRAREEVYLPAFDPLCINRARKSQSPGNAIILPGILDIFYIYLKDKRSLFYSIIFKMGWAVAMAPPAVRIYPVMKN